jgi:hypothetical protein
MLSLLLAWLLTENTSATFESQVFGMKRTQSTVAAADGVLTFDATIRSVGTTGANTSASYFIVPQLNISRCLYWTHIGVEVPAHTQVYARLSTDTNFSFFINKTAVDSSPGTISRSGLVQLEPGTHVSVISQYSVASSYWSGFLLNNLMDPLVAFYVSRSSATTHTDHIFTIDSQHVAYDTVVVNEGNCWNTENSQFKAPHTGIYLFSVSVAKTGNTSTALTVMLSLVVSHQHEPNHAMYEVGQMDLDSSDHMNTMSTSRLINLAKDDTVSVRCPDTSPFYSDSGSLATSLSGFYYSPVAINNVTQVQYTVVLE